MFMVPAQALFCKCIVGIWNMRMAAKYLELRERPSGAMRLLYDKECMHKDPY
jgi:hypothetical protein